MAKILCVCVCSFAFFPRSLLAIALRCNWWKLGRLLCTITKTGSRQHSIEFKTRSQAINVIQCSAPSMAFALGWFEIYKIFSSNDCVSVLYKFFLLPSSWLHCHNGHEAPKEECVWERVSDVPAELWRCQKRDTATICALTAHTHTHIHRIM